MTQHVPRVLVIAGLLLGALAAHAAAQDGALRPSRSLVPVVFPRWDAGGSFSFLNLARTETKNSWDGWEQKAEYRADIGRYWTTHLKTEVALSTTNGWSDYESVPLAVPGNPTAYAYDAIDRRLFTIAPAVTWQFRENTFMHPFVSAGTHVGLLREHRVRQSGSVRAAGSNDAVPPLDTRATTVAARPFIGGGFKSYLSRAAFVRTEARVGFGADGARRVSLLAGIGLDF